MNNCSKFLLLSICLSFSCGIFSQNRLRNACRADDQMKKMCEQHPEMDKEVKKNEYLTQQIIQSKDIVKSEAASDEDSEKYIIPTIFHVFGSDFGRGTTVTDEIVKDALNKTNKDFQGLNPDWAAVDAPFDTIKETMNITFELAKIDPDGNPTTGIVYYEEKAGFGDDYLKDEEIQKYAWNNYKYLNVYIMKDLYEDGDYFNSGVAWYPSSRMSNNNLARVVYNGRYLGVNTDENFRSYLTHEFGHYLNLRHTFLGGCNTENDLVDDTPAQNRSSSRKSCENKIYNCFNEEINNENYMDYSSCFKMFTHGQIQRMKAALQFDTRNTLWKENNLMATGVKNFNRSAYIVKYHGGIFEEEFNNDGIIKGQTELKCINCKFSPTQTPLVRGTDYVLSNSIPEGLQEEIKVINDRMIRIKLLGKANNHEKANSISNLTLTFLPPAIQGNIERLYSDKIKGIKILFNDPYTSHCKPRGRFRTYTHITNFTFADYPTHQSNYENVYDFSDNFKFTLTKGESYHYSVTTNKGIGDRREVSKINIWVDWNQNFIYERDELVTEKVYSNTETNENGDYTHSGTITVPDDAVFGIAKMRVFAHYLFNPERETAPTRPIGPCGIVDSGESQDYGLKIHENSPQLFVDFSSERTKTKLGDSVLFLDQSIPPQGKNISSWEWQFPGGSPSSSTLQFPEVLYPTPRKYDVSLTVTTDEGTTSTQSKSNWITSELKYCRPFINFGTYFDVTNIELNTINHKTPISNAYNHIDKIHTDLIQGNTYPITITVNKGNGEAIAINQVRVWADWNYNSIYDPTELLLDQMVRNSDYDQDGNYIITHNITVPLNAKQQRIGLRVLGNLLEYINNTDACGTFDSGNSNDYALNILAKNDDDKNIICNFIPKNQIQTHHPVIFYDQSSLDTMDEINSWQWSFPKGTPNSSNEQNPKVTYNYVENYDVTLTVNSANGQTCTLKKTFSAQLGHCQPKTSLWGYFNVKSVEFHTIDHQPGFNAAKSYENISTQLIAGDINPITITVNKGNSREDNDQNRVQIWADWDVDGTFENHELLVSKVVENTNYDANGDYRFNENIIVPLNTSPAHPIPLRIMGHFIDPFKPTSGNNACDTIYSGNAATYLLNIMPPDEERVLADFFLPIKKINKGGNILFTDQSSSTLNTSITNWYWDFPGGNPATSTQQNPNVSYEIPGVHDVTLIVTNLDKSLTDTIIKKQIITVFFNYCEPNIEYTRLFNVTRVQFNAINHQPRKGQATEYPNINTSLVAGENYPITVSANKGFAGEYERNRVQIWADWDVDGTFENHELLVSKVVENTNYDANGDYRFNENIIVPLNISPAHPIPLRIMGHLINHTKPTSGNNACDTIYSGNTATYLLNIMPPEEERVLADFSLPIKKVNKGEGIVFTDQSSSTFNTSITNWYWNFPGGNPTTSTQQNPNVSYEIPGVHDVTLIVSNLDKSLTDTIIKKQAITAFFNYCEPNIIHTNFFDVTRVQFNTINHQPRKYQATEYPNINTSLVAGENYPITVSANKGFAGEYERNRVQIWADWDVDGTFENHELLVSEVVENSDYDPNGDYRFNENIIVPLNTSPAHPIPLRIMGHYIESNQGNNACDTIDSGNAATYQLNIMLPEEEKVLADFSLPIKKVNKGEDVVFTDQSLSTFNTSITNWHWNFPGGNPTTSTQQNPNVSYEIPGIYDVTLIVTTLDKSLTDTIIKKQAITVFFNYCEPNIIHTNFFDVTRVQFNTINHQPRKGQATEYPNINTSLVAGENYPITVSANKGNGSEYDRNRVQIWADWDVDGTFENHELLVSKVVENTNYDINGDYRFNENIIVPLNTSPAHPIPLRIMGHYVEGNQGNNACDTIDSGNAATYLLNIMPPDEERILADFSLSTKKVNKGEGVVFTDQSLSTLNTSITNWYWNFPGGNPATSTQQNPNVSYEIPGVHDVTLIVTNLDKSLTDTIIKKQTVTVFFNYCEPNIEYTEYFNVTRVQFNTIDHQPRKGQATEYPNINTSLVAGENYPITVSVNKGFTGEYERNRVQIWADWDVDGTFENHEILVNKVVENTNYDPNGDYRFNENIIVPLNTSPAHPIPLRIMGYFIDPLKPTSGNNTCDAIETGNAATYLIIISTEPEPTIEPEPTEKPLGINHRKQVDIIPYPNPSSGVFKIKLKNNINIDQINFLNISGKRIYPKIIQQNDSTIIMIDMTEFSQGMYFIQTYSDKNIYTEKIIIK